MTAICGTLQVVWTDVLLAVTRVSLVTDKIGINNFIKSVPCPQVIPVAV